VDTFSLESSAVIDGKPVTVSFAGAGMGRRQLCFIDAAGHEILCRTGPAPVLPNLVLSKGRNFFQVSGDADTRQPYTLTASLAGARELNTEIEPNDTVATATAFDPKGPMHGKLDGQDTDTFRFQVEGTPQLWTMRADGQGVTNVVVLDDQGGIIGSGQSPPNAASAQAADVFLLPGTYWISVSGKDATYALFAKPTGPPDASAEREPNNDDRQAHRLKFGVSRWGKLADLDDRDCYRFSLAAYEHIALEVTPPKDGNISFEIEWGYPSPKRPKMEQVTKPAVYEAFLEPGDYMVRLRPNKASAERYRIALKRLDIFASSDDNEPNDTAPQARLLPRTFTVSGNVGGFGDDDWFLLPASLAPTSIRIETRGNIELLLRDGAADLKSNWDAATHSLTALIPSTRTLRLRVRGADAYMLNVKFGDKGPQPAAALKPSQATLSLDLGKEPITPYWVRGQRIKGALVVKNTGGTALNLALAVRSSHVAYAPTLGMQTLALAPHASASVPIEIAVLPDAWTGDGVQISVSASDKDFAPVSASATITVDANALPLAQEVAFPLPPALRGGFNVASTALGAFPLADSQDDNINAMKTSLFNGFVATDGYVVPADGMPKTIEVKFGGDKVWPVAGIAIHPQVEGRIYPAEQIADFDLLLSADGVTFTTALSGRVSMLPIEQTFVLTKPILAKAAQLRIKNNHADNVGSVGLSEWKVIASPQGTTGISVNIADPDRGGHIVRSDPLLGTSPDSAKSILVPGGGALEDAIGQDLVAQGVRPSFVIGFHEDRAAQVSALEWGENPDAQAHVHFKSVSVEASLDSPLGPWRTLGTWTLKPDEWGLAKLTLAQPEWMRFIRFKAVSPSAKRDTWVYPQVVRVFERQTSDTYRSILGEWGQYNRDAIYEATQAPAPPRLTTAKTPRSTRDQPMTLTLATPASGEVHMGRDEDWYALNLPAGLGTLGITLKGDPFITAAVELFAPDGTIVPFRVVSQSSNTIQLAAPVTPGVFRIHVTEPPHSVAITFDSSPSLSGFEPVIAHAVMAFAEGISKGREFANIANFNQAFLLPQWTDEAWTLAGAVAAFKVGASDSSDLEPTVVNAMQALKERQGTRALVVVTDAETSAYSRQSDMWHMLELIRPRTFAAEIGNGRDPAHQKQIMQDLASVNAGRYSSARTQAELDVVTERAAAWLRRPARYEIVADRISLPPPKPGSIAIVSDQVAVAPSAGQQRQANTRPVQSWGAVELILDASGSMLQPLHGKRRIEIAKKTLTDLVNKTIPPGTNVAYRIFGDDRPGSCETHLRAPLSPLNRAAMTKLFSSIRSQNLARTAIGASLLAVADDLKNAQGERTVILVTDGEETCGGNPEAEIKALRAAGIDVHINIVGFAVADDAIKDTFRKWAKLGGGTYFDARDDKELGNAMRAAVATPVKIIDAAGVVVASGTVDGGALSVPAGLYRIEVGNAAAMFRDVSVEQGDQVTLKYEGH
jgi:hypothetical protein